MKDARIIEKTALQEGKVGCGFVSDQ